MNGDQWWLKSSFGTGRRLFPWSVNDLRTSDDMTFHYQEVRFFGNTIVFIFSPLEFVNGTIYSKNSVLVFEDLLIPLKETKPNLTSDRIFLDIHVLLTTEVVGEQVYQSQKEGEKGEGKGKDRYDRYRRSNIRT